MSLESIKDSINTMNIPGSSALFYAGAGLFAGRKFCLAGGYKLGSKVAETIGSQYVATEWNKTGDKYLKLAKKDAMLDVINVAAFVGATALVLNSIENFNAYKILSAQPAPPPIVKEITFGGYLLDKLDQNAILISIYLFELYLRHRL